MVVSKKYSLALRMFYLKTRLQFTTLENLDSKEDLKRDIHGSTLEGEKDKILRVNWEHEDMAEGRREEWRKGGG